MYITLTDIQNGEPVYLARNLSVPGLDVALCELTYYHRLSNISAALGNNRASNGHTIPDGYYNACGLDEEVFQPLGIELRLHAPTGRLQLSAKKRLALNSRLAKLLGFTRRTFEPGKNIPCRRATQAYCTSRDLRASCRGKHFRKFPQRSPLYTA